MAVRIIVGILGTVVGFFMAWKTEAFMNFTGQIDFAEKYLGAGGTRLFIKILGVVFILVSWMIAFQMGGWVIRTLFLPNTPAE